MNEQASDTGRGEAAAAARELGAWLQALLIYIEPAGYAPARAPRDEAAAADYGCETRVVRDALIRCLQLLASPVTEDFELESADDPDLKHDSSTNALIRRYRAHRK